MVSSCGSIKTTNICSFAMLFSLMWWSCVAATVTIDNARSLDNNNHSAKLEREQLYGSRSTRLALPKLLVAINDSERNTSTNEQSMQNGTSIGMKLNSLLEGISAAVEDMSGDVQNIVELFGGRKKTYKMVSRNDSMMIANVDGKQLWSDKNGKGDKSKAFKFETRGKQLLIWVNEVDDSNKKVRRAKQVKHKLYLGKHEQLDGDVVVERSKTAKKGYQMRISLHSQGANKVVSVGDVKKLERHGEHWGSEREEDEFEFLEARQECQKSFRKSGIRRMLCTCHKVHASDGVGSGHGCVLRVVKAVTRRAREMGKGGTAMRMVAARLGCKLEGRMEYERMECLTRALESVAMGDGKNRRALLWEMGMSVDETLGMEEEEEEVVGEIGGDENEDEDEDVVEWGGKRGWVMGVFVWIWYWMAMGVVLLGVMEVLRMYVGREGRWNVGEVVEDIGGTVIQGGRSRSRGMWRRVGRMEERVA